MDFKLKSHKSSTALQDCGAVFGGIKIFLPRQVGVVVAMLSGCLEGSTALLPWRSAVSAWRLSLNCCWLLRCLELSSIYHRFQRFPLLIFKVFTKTLCLPHEEKLPHTHTDLQAFSHVAKSRRGSQLLIIYLLFQVTLTCVWVSFCFFKMSWYFFVFILWASTTTYKDYVRHFGSNCSLKPKKQQKIKTKTAQMRHLHYTKQRGIQDTFIG